MWRGTKTMNYETDINSCLNSAKKSKLIKKTLLAAYPDVKFSVTCEHYSGGFSFNIRWTNGPKANDIEEILEQFKDPNRAHDMEHDLQSDFYVFTNRQITDEVWKWAEKQIETINGRPFNEYSEDHTKRYMIVGGTDLRGLF